MKNTLLLLLFVFSAQFSHAQNYNCLQSGVKHYFTNSNGYLRGIRIDSVRTSGTDVIYYPFKTKRNFLSTAPDTTNGSWLGSRVIQQANGTFLFNTIMLDTVIIKTQANVGESWVFYNDSSSNYYIATVTSKDTMTILGTVDSIKTITLTAYADSAINAGDSINHFQIILSKHNGFAKTFDLYTFPYLMRDIYTSVTGTPSYLFAFSLVDYHNPTQLEIYNFNNGDVFYRHTYTSLPSYYPTLYDGYVFDSIMSKTIIDPYHTEYKMFEWTQYTNYYYDDCYMTLEYSVPRYYTDTNILEADTSLLIHLANDMPEEIDVWDSVYYYIPGDTSQCSNGTYYSVVLMAYLGFERCNVNYCYKEGFMDLSSQSFTPVTSPNPCGFVGCETETRSSTLFSMKSGTPCGPYPIPSLGIATVLYKNGTEVFPNPANNELTINTTTTLPYTITIHNIIGQEIYSLHTSQQQQTINTSELPAGLYNVTITDESGYRYNNKIVITH